MEINLIKKHELNNVIKFLSKGFSWSINRSNKIEKYIKFTNKNIDFYGFYISNSKQEIIGAILSPFQGKYIYLKKEILVIDLMSWFIIPEFRGLNSIRLVKFAIDYLDSRNFLIANFTPNKIAIKVFSNYGFKKMDTLSASFFCLEGYKYLIPFLFKNYYKKISIIPEFYSSFKETYKGGVKTYKLNIHDEEIIFKAVKTYKKKKIFGLIFFFPVLHVTPMQNFVYSDKNLELFFSILNFKFLVIAVELDLDKRYLDINSKYANRFKSRYLLFSKEKLVTSVPFFGSEFVIN